MTSLDVHARQPAAPVRVKPLVIGMDIATTTGIAHGRADGRPTTLTWNLREGGKTRPQRLGLLGDLCFDLFTKLKPDMLFYEQGMSMQAALSIGTSDETFCFLRGAIGVVEAVAAKCLIPTIRSVGVQEARKHLLGRGKIPKGEGKQLVFDRCKVLRWPVSNLDESDGCAIWSFGCGEANPMASIAVTPLFSGAA